MIYYYDTHDIQYTFILCN